MRGFIQVENRDGVSLTRRFRVFQAVRSAVLQAFIRARNGNLAGRKAVFVILKGTIRTKDETDEDGTPR